MRAVLMAVLITITVALVYGCKPAPKTDAQSASAIPKPIQQSIPAENTQAELSEPAASGPGTAELQASIFEAATQNRYAFLVFHNGGDATGSAMRQEVESIVNSKLSTRARFIGIDTTNQGHAELLAKYGVSSASLPLTIVVAPNGAVTAGFPQTIPDEVKQSAFNEALTSPRMADVLLAIQQGKLAAICIQGAKTKHNSASMKVARSLAADPKFAASTVVIITVDPADAAEAKIMQVFRIDPGTTDAQLVVVAPPGRVVGKFAGTATAKEVVSAVSQALSGAGGG